MSENVSVTLENLLTCFVRVASTERSFKKVKLIKNISQICNE